MAKKSDCAEEERGTKDVTMRARDRALIMAVIDNYVVFNEKDWAERAMPVLDSFGIYGKEAEVLGFNGDEFSFRGKEEADSEKVISMQRSLIDVITKWLSEARLLGRARRDVHHIVKLLKADDDE